MLRHFGLLLAAASTGWSLLAGAPAESAGMVPPELVGKWGFAVAIGEYCVDVNRCAPGSGGSISFEFRPDGTTTFALVQSALVDGCGLIRSLELKDGRIRVTGGTIVFTPSAGTYESVNDCRPDLSGTWKFDPSDLRPVSLHWHIEGSSLRITDSSGEASGVYSRL